MLENHFRRTVLDHMPKAVWQKLDEPNMIGSPNLDEFVFCRVLEAVEIDHFDPTYQDERDEDYLHEHPTGSSIIVRYRLVRDLVLQGKVELL